MKLPWTNPASPPVSASVAIWVYVRFVRWCGSQEGPGNFSALRVAHPVNRNPALILFALILQHKASCLCLRVSDLPEQVTDHLPTCPGLEVDLARLGRHRKRRHDARQVRLQPKGRRPDRHGIRKNPYKLGRNGNWLLNSLLGHNLKAPFRRTVVIDKPAFRPSARPQLCHPPNHCQGRTIPPGRNGRHCTYRWRTPNAASVCCKPAGIWVQCCRSLLCQGRGTCP